MAEKLTVAPPRLGKDNTLWRDAMKVRVPVFVVEQNIPEENEVDGEEQRSWHFVCYNHENSPVGALRIVMPPHAVHEEGPEKEPEGNYCKLGRLATLKEWRGKGVAAALVEAAVKFMKENPEEVGCRDENGQRVHGEWDGRLLARAQIQVKGAWERMGFVHDESMGEWIEEGIRHCGMWRRVRE
jgi:predicted GNAT family N-acyltransferase